MKVGAILHGNDVEQYLIYVENLFYMHDILVFLQITIIKSTQLKLN